MGRAKLIEPRMLTREQAANYCGQGSRFRSHCPVRPKRVAPGQQGLRYDRVELDRWLDTLPKDGQIPILFVVGMVMYWVGWI